MATYVKASKIRALAKSLGKRTSKHFIETIDRHVANCIKRGVTVHNGGRKTLDRHVALHIFGNQ